MPLDRLALLPGTHSRRLSWAARFLARFQLLLDSPRVHRVVPFGTFGVRFYLESFKIFTFYLLSSLIKAPVQEGFNFQSRRRARSPNVPQHDFESLQGLSLPIHADVAEQAMLNRVPL